MCASLLRQMGVRKVFFGAGNEKFGGNGGVLEVQSGNGRRREGGGEDWEVDEGEADYEVSGGWLREDAILVLRRFYVQENERGQFSALLALILLALILLALIDLSDADYDSTGTAE